jgi:hypothetical protein
VRSHAKAASAPSAHRENRTFSLGVLAAMLVCAAAFLGIGAPAASAAAEAGPGWAYQNTFGKFEDNVYDIPRSPVAVDSNGNLFAVNQNTGQVKVYAPGTESGDAPLTDFTPAGGIVRNIAIDLSDDTLYADEISSFGGTTIRRYTSDGQATPTYTIDPAFELPQGEGIAVDPTTGNLLVADPGAEAVRRYDTTGKLLATIATPSINPAWIVVAPDGSLYVAPAEGPDVTHLSGTGTVLSTAPGVGAPHGLTYDPTSSVLVALVGATLKTYSPAGALRAESPAQDEKGIGIAVDGNANLLYEHHLTNVNEYVAATVPGVVGPEVSGIGPHTVHLRAEVDPGAGPPAGSEMHFELSTDGGITWTSTPSEEVTAPATFEADVTDLLPNQDYLIRAVASNDLVAHTTDAVAFSTPEIAPEAVAGNATDVTETSAVLNGTVNPAGFQTTYHFEYGTTTAYGSQIPVGIEAVAGAGQVNRIFSRTITGLQPGTTYHFRIVAENAVGVTESADRTFTTVAAGAIPRRAFEQVTPADKKGNPIDPHFGFFASEDGNGFSYLNRGGDDSSPLLPRALSIRGSDDWVSGVSLDAPTNAIDFNVFYSTVQAVSPDLTKSLVVTNKALTPDAADPGTNVYMTDLSDGSYTLVGSSPFTFAFSQFAGANQQDHYSAGSADFSWVVFDSVFPLLPDAPFNAYYRWSEEDGLEVISVLPDGTQTSALHSPRFHFVSEDGSRFYFTSGGNFEVGVPYLRENGETKPLSVSQIPDDPTTTPQPGVVLGASKDGRYVFFADTGSKLTADAPGVEGDIYRYDASDGSIEFIGGHTQGGFPAFTKALTLAISDNGDTIYLGGAEPGGPPRVWRDGTLTTLPTKRSLVQSEVVASPNGRYFGWAETTSVGTQLRGQISLYDADTDEKFCVSCLPDGSPGVGEISEGKEIVISNRLPHAITDQGQFFFTGVDRLVAADVNGHEDVYMFKDGKPSLISPGNAPFDAIYADVSLDGRDVFFTTSQKLVGRDNDQVIDVYDARVGGGLASQNPPPPQECLRDDCKGTPNAGPELPFGGSEALNGPENVKPKPRKKHCGRGKRAKKVKGKVRCVKKHRANKAGKGGKR